MIEIVWQYDPSMQKQEPAPASAGEAHRLLEEGNHDFAELVANIDEGKNAQRVIKISPGDLGISDTPGTAPKQAPFAAILSCADARVPTELVFAQAANNLFTVRVAGNVLASACLGSLDYAVGNLESVRLLVVLGHTGCGAVSAAVDSMQTYANYIKVAVNQPLRVIVDSLVAVVTSAEYTLHNIYGPEVAQSPGYRSALIEMAVSMNAAIVAGIIRENYSPRITENLDIVYGIYNLHNRLVGRPAGEAYPGNWEAGLFSPPQDEDGFVRLSNQLAGSDFIKNLLDGKVD